MSRLRLLLPLEEKLLPVGPPMLQHLHFLQEAPVCKFHISMPGSSSPLVFQGFNFFFFKPLLKKPLKVHLHFPALQLLS